eukprot:TRINITY_DN3811_c1_g1_i2.p1 TRINITY_DN3811_c1_g1~~TRINITY_DN3811_c1_g1_i2.p1  ORF type:complete len:475 (+),score=153.20 TRINITY_DN3811_c1_g1_i2:51-1427(+)
MAASAGADSCSGRQRSAERRAQQQEERRGLRAQQEELSRLLRRIAVDMRRAAELAASVQRQLVERLQAEQGAGLDAELDRLLGTAVQLQLQLLLEPAGRTTTVSLSVDATVSELQAAVQEVGGPVPPLQVLTIGGQRLRCAGRTLLRDTRLVRPHVCVVVRRTDLRRKRVAAGKGHSVALLESGEVRCSGASPVPAATVAGFAAGSVTSVHAWGRCVAAVVEGRLQLWGLDVGKYSAALAALSGREVVCCSVTSGTAALGVVDSTGCLLAWDRDGRRLRVPAELDGRVAAVSVRGSTAAVVTSNGDVVTLRCSPLTRDFHIRDRVAFGEREAVSVSTGAGHYAVLLDDGSVRCYGDNMLQQCAVPVDLRDVVSCECGPRCTVALRVDGTVCSWGDCSPVAGRWAAVTANSGNRIVGVTIEDRLSESASRTAKERRTAEELSPALCRASSGRSGRRRSI